MFIPRCFYDEDVPQGAKSLSEVRNSGFRPLFQTDFQPLRVRASMILDSFEYPADASIQAVWAGTGCTVTKSTTKHDGNFAGSVAVDGTGNRTVTKTHSIDLSLFSTLKVWEQVDVASSEFQFFVSDGVNESYWDITSDGTLSTWKQESLDLTTPDSNSGSPADLTAVTSYGFKGLDASKTYLFDDLKAICGMTVAVETSYPGGFYRPVYIGGQPLEMAAKAAPEITAPSANPRIDILCVSSAGTLSWVVGDEAASPVPKWASVVTSTLPIVLVYCKTTMTSVLDYEDKDTDGNQGYIYGDVRPLYFYNPLTDKIQDADTDTKIQVEESADEDKVRIDTGGTQRVLIDSDGVTLASGASVNEFSTDATLAGNSDDAVPTEKAVKTYADSGLAKIYIGTFTHDLSVTGAQAITGVGFQPKAVLAFVCVDGAAGRMSIGFDDGTTPKTIFDNNQVTTGSWGLSNFLSLIVTTDSTYSAGKISALGADGFTITWTKSGSPTGTATIIYLAVR